MRLIRRYRARGAIDPEALRQFGQVFDDVAEAYDEVRPGYPDELVDARRRARQDSGRDHASLEIGCGTAKLTELLAARGARRRRRRSGTEHDRGRAEARRRRRVGQHSTSRGSRTSSSPANAYAAVFSATAFHWVDPAVGWRKSASLLEPGGLARAAQAPRASDDPSNDELDAEFRALIRKYAPELAETLSPNRDLRVDPRRRRGAREANASETWDWLIGASRRGLAVPDGG